MPTFINDVNIERRFLRKEVVRDKPCNQVGSKAVNAAVPRMFNVADVL